MSDAGELHRTQETFGKGPIGLLLDKTVSDGAVRQYVYMHWRYGKNHQNWETRESIAEAMGVSETTVTNRTHQLENIDWIVVIRQYDDRTKKTRNFYHVFETQEDCRLWRIEHKFVKPAYDGDPRKLRTGKGGKPNHKVDEDSNPNSGLDRGNVNSGLDRDVNSSSHYLDSVDPDSNTSDAPNGGQQAAVIPIPDKPRKRNDEFDALATVWFDATVDTPEFAALGGRIGQHAAWLRGKQITVKRNGTKTVVPGCQHQVTADILEKAKADWYRQNPSAHHPTDILKFVQHIDRFCRHLFETTNSTGSLLPARADCPKCGGMGAYTSNGVLVPVCECRKGANNAAAT